MNIQKGKTESPCMGCTDRKSECHTDCERYQEFLEIHERERAEINSKRHKENLSYGAPWRTERQMQNIKSNMWKYR